MTNYISVKAAALHLGISRQRVQDLIKTGKLAALRLEGSQTWLIKESDVLKRLQEMAKR